jgi:plasmid stabilization system protein ParE
MKVVKRPRFLLDLAEELEWLNHRAGGEIAERWYASLKSTIDELRRHPRLGRERTDLAPPGVRSWRVNRFRRWLLFYMIREDTLVLLRVRYATMDLGALRLES